MRLWSRAAPRPHTARSLTDESIAGQMSVIESTSPDGRWKVQVREPGPSAGDFYATVRDSGAGTGPSMQGIPFGYAASPDHLTVRWDLPDQTLGMFLSGECYLLFRYGSA